MATSAATRKLGIYIHIPFCRKKCDYCGFYSIPVGSLDRTALNSIINDYVKKLEREIEIRAPELTAYTADTVYFGGGSPSLLAPGIIARILGKLAEAVKIDTAGVEITLECNPEDFSISRCMEYIGSGVNRIVLGVQTLSDRLRAVIGRSACSFDSSILDEFFTIPGIAHCIDIITGIPGQGDEEFLSEMDRLSGYRPEHISAYMLNIEKGTPLFERLRYTEEMGKSQAGMFRKMIDTLGKKGYRHYEVSNFALPSFESRHNLKYWKYLPYAGFGAAAHSFYGNVRFYNTQSVYEYIADDGVHLNRDKRDKKAEIAEYILTGMRLRDGISLNDFELKLGITMPDDLRDQFRILKNEGLVAVDKAGADEVFRFTMEGLFMTDSLVYRLVNPYL